MGETVLVPGGRDVRATLDVPDGRSTSTGALVVACPPHPQMGGTRSDRRLQAVSDALTDRGVACLRFDYGPWDGGDGERTDARNALEWGRERSDRVGLFGYSFGATIALLAAADGRGQPDALSVLAPAARLDGPELDAVAAVDGIDCPLQIVVGERDETVEWLPVVERARERRADVETASAPVTIETVRGDHHFAGQQEQLATLIADFLAGRLTDG